MILEKHWVSVGGGRGAGDALENDLPITIEDFHCFTNWERIIPSLTLVVPFLVGISSSITPPCPGPQAPYVHVSRSLENLEALN